MHNLSSSMQTKNMYFNRTTGQNLKICINSLSNWIWGLFFIVWRYSKSFFFAVHGLGNVYSNRRGGEPTVR